jgi:hypothetical protein
LTAGGAPGRSQRGLLPGRYARLIQVDRDL